MKRLFGISDGEDRKRLAAVEAIDRILEGAFEADVIDMTGLTTPSVQVVSSERSVNTETRSAKSQISGNSIGVMGGALQAAQQRQVGNETAAGISEGFSKIVVKTFNLSMIMTRIQKILDGLQIRTLYIFIDDFSELPKEAMHVFVDAVLAPLNNWSNELIKFKVAAYPNRIYLGEIDPSKMDEVHLDTYKLYGINDISFMEEKAIDFTRRLIKSRFDYYVGKQLDYYCEGDSDEIYKQLFFASMGNARILGHILHNLRESHVAYGKPIGLRSIQDAAARYYEEKVEPFFGIKKFAHESFEERSSIYSLKELLEFFVKKARDLREYKDSAVTKDIRGRTPSSHFHVLREFEPLLSTLELNFFLTKYFEMKDRDGRKVAVYALNYGLCAKQTIAYGRPTGRREYRLYFVERIFDYSPIIRSYLVRNQEIKCDNCGAVHDLEKLESLKLFNMLCPTCQSGRCKVSNLSKKYETILKEVNEELLLPATELGIMETLYNELKGLPASDIASELDCSYQLVGKRGKIMEERGLVSRKKEAGRRIFLITEQALENYFRLNKERHLNIPHDRP